MKEIIPKRATNCRQCLEPLRSGDEVFSLLVRDEGVGLRKDYCKSCSRNIPDRFREAKWKGRVPSKEKPPPDFQALNVFHTLRLSQEVSDRKKCFLLAIYLARKKQLILRKEDKTKHTLLYEDIESGEIVEVEAQLILPDEVADLTLELENLCQTI